jgi:hypothetical protein
MRKNYKTNVGQHLDEAFTSEQIVLGKGAQIGQE